MKRISLICQLQIQKKQAMRNFIFPFLFLLFTPYIVISQVFEESFESWPPSGWTLNPEIENGAWEQNNGNYLTDDGNAGPGFVMDGEFAAMFNNYEYIPDVEGSLISPEFDLSSLNHPLLTFFWWNNDAPLEPSKLILSSSTDGISFTSLDTIIATQSGENWREYFKIIPSNVTHIKITAISDFGYKNTYVDALSISEGPDCLPPTDLVVNNITGENVQIDWQNGDSETEWTVEYGIEGFELGTGTNISTSSHPLIIYGLTSQTDYEIYVKSNCGTEDSPWTGPLQFTTACAIVSSYPWQEGFENGNLACFSVEQNNEEETWYWTNETAFVGPYEGIGYARIAYSVDPQNEWLISPVFDFSNVINANLTFHWSLSYSYAVDPSDNYDLILKVTNNGGFSWTNIWDESMVGVFENWVYYEENVDLSNYQGEENIQFAFNYVGTDGAAAYIDEIRMDVSVGNDEKLAESLLNIYPNPFDNFVNIESDNTINRISLFNILGKKVYEEIFLSTHFYTVNMLDLPKGTYMIQIETNESVLSSKLIKE